MTEHTPGAPPAVDPIPSGVYQVDAERSFLSFRAKAFGLMWVRGTMPAAHGSISIDDGRLRGTGAITAAAVDTGVRPRDWHLRSGHYLDTATHPQITMTIDDAEIGTGLVDCVVTVRGTPSTVPMRITALGLVDGALHLRAGADVDRTPFPMLPPLAGVSRMVRVDLDVLAHPASA